MPAHSVGISKDTHRFSEQYPLREETVPDYRVLGTDTPHAATHGREIASHSMGLVVSKMMHDKGYNREALRRVRIRNPTPVSLEI
jgi:hypothetical protein